MRLTPDAIGQRVTLVTGQRDTYAEGKVVAYCEAPMVLIETPAGEQIWWRADLATTDEEGL